MSRLVKSIVNPEEDVYKMLQIKTKIKENPKLQFYFRNTNPLLQSRLSERPKGNFNRPDMDHEYFKEMVGISIRVYL